MTRLANPPCSGATAPAAVSVVVTRFKGASILATVASGTFPANTRVVFKEPARAESAFLEIGGPGCFSGSVASAGLSYNPAAPGPDVNSVEAIHFMIPTLETASIDFNFCISDISVM